MARRKGNDINGWLILDKPQGLTSNQALGRLKRLYNPKKVGHAGTLDPLATGVLPIAFGEATKTVAHVVNCEKTYDFTIRWGVGDNWMMRRASRCGRATRGRAARPSRRRSQPSSATSSRFHPAIPPSRSMANALVCARDGDAVELTPRPVSVYELDIEEPQFAGADAPHLRLRKRHLRPLHRPRSGPRARLLWSYRGAEAHIVGPFDEENAISLEKLEQFSNSADGYSALMGAILPVETALDGIPALAISGDDAARLKRGQSILIRGGNAPILKGPIYATSRGVLVAIGEVERGEMHPIRVFNIPA